jgi:DNA-binding FrmR family transcriptional regulator
MEHRLFDRLGALDANQTKVLGHMSEIERIVQSEQRERREITTRIDAVHSALGNFAARFGSVEVSLQKAIDGRVAEGV